MTPAADSPAPAADGLAPPAEGEARQVAEGILWLRLPMPWRLDHVNVYALEDGDGWMVIDTGIATGRSRDIWGTLLAGPLSGRPVRRLIATHHHPDHMGLAGWFVDRGAELWASRTAWLTARMLTLDVMERPPARLLAFWRDAGMAADLWARKAGERPFNMADIVDPVPTGYHRIADGQDLRIGGQDWRVRFGQGHAPDQITLWSGGEAPVVIGADQILARISPNISVHATEPEADPLGEWLASCRRLAAAPGADAALVLPGHDLPFAGAAARLAQMERNHLAALDRLEAGLATPRTACDCFGLLFRRAIGAEEYVLALGETLAHLNRLRAEGRVARQGGGEAGAWLWHRT